MVVIMGLPEKQCRDIAERVCATFDVDLEDLNISRAGRREVLRVVVDRDGGIDLDDIAEISRMLSEVLDQAINSDDSPFVLEVSSPGVDRPLTEIRHWRRALGHLVHMDHKDSQKSGTYRISSVDHDSITLTDQQDVSISVVPADVEHAVVQVEFNRGE